MDLRVNGRLLWKRIFNKQGAIMVALLPARMATSTGSCQVNKE
jgi:hypothetical protein